MENELDLAGRDPKEMRKPAVQQAMQRRRDTERRLLYAPLAADPTQMRQPAPTTSETPSEPAAPAPSQRQFRDFADMANRGR